MSNEHDEKFSHWVEWIKRIEADINRQQVIRYFFALLNDIWKNNPSLPPSAFPDFFAAMYAESQGASVRRLLDMDTRTFSLTLLLKEIEDNPEVLSKRRFFEMQGVKEQPANISDKQLVEWANEAWKTFGAGDNIDPAIVYNDLELLRERAEVIKRWVNKYVAHTDRMGMEDLPTFADHRSGSSQRDTFRCRPLPD